MIKPVDISQPADEWKVRIYPREKGGPKARLWGRWGKRWVRWGTPLYARPERTLERVIAMASEEWPGIAYEVVPLR